MSIESGMFNIQVKDENGTTITNLNSFLINRQNLNEKDVERIKELHVKKHKVLNLMNKTDDVQKLIELSEMITELEFDLQRAWKFNPDINFHRFWLLPKCKCPKIDNQEAYPTGRYYVNQSCPIHGTR